MAKIDVEGFRISARGEIELAGRPTTVPPVYDGKGDYKDRIEAHVRKLSDLQERLYASGAASLLIVFQALDAAGKDGAIKHVMSGVNPQGCQVFSFKHPGPVELEHDFLWRHYAALPERGRIGIFNRSYYEEVLITRVHPDILVTEERVPADLDREEVFKGRYKSIRHFERHLHRNGTRVVKIFLHLSREEQRKRFLSRIEEADKNWKLSRADMEERRFFDAYLDAYGRAIGATSVKTAPWWIVPADDKENARLFISQIILNTLDDMDLPLLAATPERERLLEEFRRELEAEA